LSTDDLPVIKGTSGILVLNEEDLDKSRQSLECIRCGKCVKNCPMNLYPNLISKYAEKGMVEQAEKVFAMDCFECGCCAFNCPSHIPLVHWIRFAKSEIMKRRAQQKK
jgi:Na+-translocating ferredoxin:NAD+ oxidoreductase subunit C